MTFGILKANAHNKKLRIDPDLRKKYKLDGYYYEHKTNTCGFVYKEKALRYFVKKQKVDPTTLEGTSPLKNYADDFARWCNNLKVIVFEKSPVLFEHSIIKQNFVRYKVYRQR